LVGINGFDILTMPLEFVPHSMREVGMENGLIADNHPNLSLENKPAAGWLLIYSGCGYRFFCEILEYAIVQKAKVL
jgi:hypothetical protein